MNNNPSPPSCPQCGAPAVPGAPEGLCPQCLLGLNLATPTHLPGETAVPGPRLPEPPSVAEVARLFPQLEIIRLVGQGGMGAVYLARQPALDRFVALKILTAPTAAGRSFTERFTREARALAALNHPNIVTVHDFGETDGRCYLLMEFVDGLNLRELIRARKVAPAEALAIVPGICDALQFAHERGIVHRDIKPENILLDKQGRVKIADFGIAKLLGSAPAADALTGAQDRMGTPHYMAPEQVEQPLAVDHRADIYSLGVVFYELLTGELPLGRFAPPSRKVRVDVRLDEVVLHALEKEPERRYQHASEVRTAVETITSLPSAAHPSPDAADHAGAMPAETEALTRTILARDCPVDIGRCFRRAWALVRSDFWPIIGVTALMLVLLGVVSSPTTSFGSATAASPAGRTTSALFLLLYGPFMGGLSWYYLKKIRGEKATVETAFAGFSHRFLQLFLGGFVSLVLVGVGFACLILPGIYLWVCWMFTLTLIMDQRLDFWPAMRLSRRVVTRHWWKFFGFALLAVLLSLLGLVALIVGFFVLTPVAWVALTYAYEDIFGAAAASPAGKLSSRPA